MADAERRRVTLTDIAFGGDCIARHDNKVIFASYGIPGEDVIVELSQDRRDYQRGKVVEVVSPAPARIALRCPLFERCGGCRWQHIDYPAQLELKRKIVADQLRRIGRFGDTLSINPPLGAETPWHYRNNTRFTLRDGELGFLEEGSHRFLAVDECHLLHPAIDDALTLLQGRTGTVAGQVAVRYGVNTGQLLIDPAPLMAHLALPRREYLEEELLGRRFRIAPTSFFQVNTAQAERMAEYVLARLDAGEKDVVLDIYCGVGTIGLLVADKVAQMIGVEESAIALQDAAFNARGQNNVRFIEGAAETVMGRLREHIDAAIVDPPRAGCKREVIDALKRLRPGKLIYISCDPATLARDLRLLCMDNCYAIKDVQPVDMFPQTYHIETVVTLEPS